METGLDLGTMAALGLLVTGGTYLAWPDAPAEAKVALAQPMPEALARLRGEERVVEGTGMGSLKIAASGTDGDALLIGIKRAGDRKAVTCRVTIAAASPTTSSALVDCTQKQLDDRPIRRVAARALDLIVTEHVAATVDARAYDIDAVSTRLIALAALNPAAMADAAQPPRD